MFELLFAFAFWPWLFTAVFVVALGFSAAFDDALGPVASIAVFWAACWFFFDVNIFSYVFEHPVNFLVLALGYAFFGVLWSFYKWRRHLTKDHVQKDLMDAKREYATSFPDKAQAAPLAYLRDPAFRPDSAAPWKNKSRLTSWISLWPVSVFLALFQDWLYEAWTAIWGWVYDSLGRVYERIVEGAAPK